MNFPNLAMTSSVPPRKSLPKTNDCGIRIGLFDEKHYRQMGDAVWLFGWLLGRQTTEDGQVLHGRAITAEEIATDTGYPVRSVQRWAAVLRKLRYIDTEWKYEKGRRSGIAIRVLNPKKIMLRKETESLPPNVAVSGKHRIKRGGKSLPPNVAVSAGDLTAKSGGYLKEEVKDLESTKATTKPTKPSRRSESQVRMARSKDSAEAGKGKPKTDDLNQPLFDLIQNQNHNLKSEQIQWMISQIVTRAKTVPRSDAFWLRSAEAFMAEWTREVEKFLHVTARRALERGTRLADLKPLLGEAVAVHSLVASAVELDRAIDSAIAAQKAAQHVHSAIHAGEHRAPHQPDSPPMGPLRLPAQLPDWPECAEFRTAFAKLCVAREMPGGNKSTIST